MVGVVGFELSSAERKLVSRRVERSWEREIMIVIKGCDFETKSFVFLNRAYSYGDGDDEISPLH